MSGSREASLDVEIAASGFTKDMQQDFEDVWRQFCAAANCINVSYLIKICVQVTKDLIGGPDYEEASDSAEEQEESEEREVKNVDFVEDENKTERVEESEELVSSANKDDVSSRCGDCENVQSSCMCARPPSPPSIDQLSLVAEDDDFEFNENHTFQAFRDFESTQKVNSHERRRQRASDSTTSTVSSMDARLVKDKVKRHMKSKQQQLYARRIRKSGEAALATKKRRENLDDIKQSTSAVWF